MNCDMKISAPFLFLKDILIDTLRRPSSLSGFAAFYQNTRSYSHPVGVLPLISIFDFVPDAATRRVVFEGIFEAPLFPVEHKVAAQHETGSTSLRDSYYLALICQRLNPDHIIEVGTSYGESALLFAVNSKSDCSITTLDIQRDNPTVGSKFRSAGERAKIRQEFCSLKRLHETEPALTADLFFIDGDHSYAGVMEDSIAAMEMLRPGGVILWHDYCFRFRNDVVRALDELRVKHGYDIRKLSYTNLAVFQKSAASSGALAGA